MNMNLNDYTEEQLREELTRRQGVTLNDDQHLCLGIVDIDGVESIFFCDTAQKFSDALKTLQLRARFNSQRRPVLYCAKMPRSLFQEFSDRIKEGKHKEVGEAIMGLSNRINIGY